MLNLTWEEGEGLSREAVEGEPELGSCQELSCSIVPDFLWPHEQSLPAPLTMEFSRQECCGLPCPLQGICLTQGSNPGLPQCRRILYHLSHQGSPRILEWVAYRTMVSCIAGGFFTSWTTREVQVKNQYLLNPHSASAGVLEVNSYFLLWKVITVLSTTGCICFHRHYSSSYLCAAMHLVRASNDCVILQW